MNDSLSRISKKYILFVYILYFITFHTGCTFTHPITAAQSYSILPKQRPGNVLIALAHQDDDVFIVSRIKHHIDLGDTVYVIWTAYSDQVNAEYANTRILEAHKAMEFLNIPENHYWFLKYKDGRTYEHAFEIISFIKSLIPQLTPSTIYIPAFEGGHIDHDIVNFAVARALSELNYKTDIYEFPIYNSYNIPFFIPFLVRNIIPFSGTYYRQLNKDEFAFVLQYWNIYKSQHFPLDYFINLTVGKKAAFGVEYLIQMRKHDYENERLDFPLSYPKYLPGINHGDFLRAVKNNIKINH